MRDIEPFHSFFDVPIIHITARLFSSHAGERFGIRGASCLFRANAGFGGRSRKQRRRNPAAGSREGEKSRRHHTECRCRQEKPGDDTGNIGAAVFSFQDFGMPFFRIANNIQLSIITISIHSREAA